MFGASEKTKQLSAVSQNREKRASTEFGVAAEATAVTKPYLMMDDEGYRRRGAMYWIKPEPDVSRL